MVGSSIAERADIVQKIALNAVRLTDVFAGLANRCKGRTAVVSPRVSLTYDELLMRAARSARELRANGIVPGARVAIALRDSGETIVLMIALWMLGATAVPIDFRSNAAERGKLASEFDLLAVLEDRQAQAASMHPCWPTHRGAISLPNTMRLHSGQAESARPPYFVDLRHDVTSGRVRARS